MAWERLKKILIIAVLLLAPVAGGAQPSGGFVAGLEDVPLPADFSVVRDSTTVFDKPEGRIVESYATGPGSSAAVLAFYDEALAHLGWERLGPGRFLREGELLQIEIIAHDGPLTVRYRLAPQS